MKKLIHYAIHQPLFIVLGAVLFALAGAMAFKQLSVEAFPDVTDTQVTVIALYPGRAAEEVEKQVTLPLEVALSGLPQSIRVFSHTQFGLSYTVITYNDEISADLARQHIIERLGGVSLPAGVEVRMAPNATPVGEIIRFRLRGDGHSTTALRTLQDWTVERSLRQIPGVADVVTMGGYIKQYEVQPDLAKLRAHHLTLQDLLQALERGNSNAGGSYISHGAQQYAIRGIGLLRSPEEIGQIVLKASQGSPVRVSDVARIEVGGVPRLGTVGQDQDDDIVSGLVLMRKGENPSIVLRAVKDRLATLNNQLPPGVRIEPYYDRTWLMDKTLSTVFRNLVEGALLVSLVLYLFLSNLRASLAVVVVIPLSLLATFMGLKIMGVPANLLSLGAMDFGIIVDGAVIMIENIMHRLAQRGEGMNDKERKTLIIQAANEVGRPTLFSMLIIIAAHIPIFALERHEGRIFQPMALSVTSALIGSLIFSLTLVPLLAYWMLRKGLPHHDNWLVEGAKRLYRPVLDWALAKTRQVMVLAMLSLALALGVATQLGSEFLPELNEGSLWVNLRLPGSVSNEEATQILGGVRRALATIPEVRSTISKAGQPEDGTDPKTISMAEVFVDLRPAEEWRPQLTRDQLLEEIDRTITRWPGLKPTYSMPIRDNVLESISQIDGQIVIKIAGDDLGTLRDTAEAIESQIRGVPGVYRAEIDRLGELPQLVIDIDRARAARYGINVADVQDVIESALAGKAATYLWEGERRFAVVVRLANTRRQIEELGTILIPTPGGGSVSLAQVTHLKEAVGAMNIAREAGRRTMAIGIFIKGRDMGSVVADMKKRVSDHVKLPAHYTLTWSGEFENQERAMKRLAVVVPISLLLIFVLLFDAFKTLKSAALILVNVPLALVGGIFALWIFGVPLSVSAAIGFIALSGQAVLNGVVMLTVFQQLRAAGLPLIEAVREGSMQRLRTVLMTALLAALGLLPMALSHDIGSETQRPLALVVIGGLVSATLLTLVVLPTLYVAWFAPRHKEPPLPPTTPSA